MYHLVSINLFTTIIDTVSQNAECVSLAVTSTLVLYLKARMELESLRCSAILFLKWTVIDLINKFNQEKFKSVTSYFINTKLELMFFQMCHLVSINIFTAVIDTVSQYAECVSLSVTSTLVLYLKARMELESFRCSTILF